MQRGATGTFQTTTFGGEPVTFPTAGAGMEVLHELGIAREVTGKRRNRVFAYGKYPDILDEGTETP